MKLLYIIVFSLLLASCAGLPKNIEPVADFELNKYMGKWYEIARLDHSFEKDLEQVTATYSIKSDGTVRVANRGLSSKSKEWKDAVGKAKFAGDSSVGYLKVSFFGPFYGSYVIFDLDKENYQYSFVTGGENYLWLLSRTPTIGDEIKNKFLNTIQEYGYNTEELIFVNQE
jgi:apolipoprotein D and lipocalin family protein